MKLPKLEISSGEYNSSYNFILISDHIWIGDDVTNCKSNDIKWFKLRLKLPDNCNNDRINGSDIMQ